MKKIIVTYAVEKELIDMVLPGCEIKYVCTGVGKANAAMKLTKAICEESPELVLNIGTAGTLQHRVGEIVVCSHFYDRDFQTIQLPGIDWEIESTNLLEKDVVARVLIAKAAIVGSCNTGDSFVTEVASLEGNVVDMEAFAEAIVCREFGVSFIAVKYITDKIGENSVQHWLDKLADARTGLKKWFDGVAVDL